MATLFKQSAQNPFYKFKIIAKSGDLGIKEIKKEVSINDKGQIAFVGSGFEEEWTVVTHTNPGLKTLVKQDHVFAYDDQGGLRDLSEKVILATAANPYYGIVQPNVINALSPLIKNPTRTFDIFKTSYISPGTDASDRSSGIQINNNGDIVVRRFEISSGWTFLGLKEDFGVYPFHYWTPEPNKYASFLETWSADKDGNQSPQLISQGFITSYLFPDTYSPIPRLPLVPIRTYKPDFGFQANIPSINNKGEVVFRAAGPDNWIAIHDPDVPISNPQWEDPFMFKTNVPDLSFHVWSSDDNLFIRSSKTSLETFDKQFRFKNIIDDSFTRIGTQSRISDDGNVIAFYGERSTGLPSDHKKRVSTSQSDAIKKRANGRLLMSPGLVKK